VHAEREFNRKSAMQTRDMKPHVGTEVIIDRDDFLSGKYAKDIERLLVERSALVFREMHLTKDEQLRFAATIGDPIAFGDSAVSNISLDPEVSTNAEYTRGAFYWHIDGANDAVPAKATMLTAKKLSDKGGDTLICNTYAAYADLPEDEKRRIDGFMVRHALEATQRMVRPDYTSKDLEIWRSRSSQTHPLVWHHQHGGTSLLIGATALYVHDMSPEDSAMLLARMMDYATQDKYVYRHKWTVGDFLLWDNTGTIHRADFYPLDSDRLMHRTTLHGEEPVTVGKAVEAA
jgi:alpha-ketoglutarate-dependent taurine dioxygenase